MANSIRVLIKLETYLTMACSKILVLYRGTFYYRRGGHGLKQIMDKVVLDIDIRMLMYALYTENR